MIKVHYKEIIFPQLDLVPLVDGHRGHSECDVVK
jgi:hypothetical protein